MKTSILYMERSTSGINYRSAYVVKFDTFCITIDWTHDKPRENTIQYSKVDKNDIISDRMLFKNGAVKVTDVNMQHDLIVAFFLAVRT